jgi:murein L,D-transpeptidase YcbB/YkuD
METVVYLQLAQNYESELEKLDFKSLEGLKIVAKSAGVFAVSGAALASSLLVSSPALACDTGCLGNSQPVSQPTSCCQRPVAYSSCYSSCTQTQSYYPDYYYDTSQQETSYSPSYSNCGCRGSNESYSGVSYQPVEASNLLEIGSSGQLVALLQQTLLQAGFDPGEVDGVYGHQTASAVAQYQAANGLFVDGVAGGQTLDSLGLAGAGA